MREIAGTCGEIAINCGTQSPPPPEHRRPPEVAHLRPLHTALGSCRVTMSPECGPRVRSVAEKGPSMSPGVTHRAAVPLRAWPCSWAISSGLPTRAARRPCTRTATWQRWSPSAVPLFVWSGGVCSATEQRAGPPFAQARAHDAGRGIGTGAGHGHGHRVQGMAKGGVSAQRPHSAQSEVTVPVMLLSLMV